MSLFLSAASVVILLITVPTLIMKADFDRSIIAMKSDEFKVATVCWRILACYHYVMLESRILRNYASRI